MIELAKQLKGLDPDSSLPDHLLVKAEQVGDAADAYCKAGGFSGGQSTEPIDTVLLDAGREAGGAYHRIAELGGNPDFPQIPFYAATFVDIHKSK